MELTVGAKAPDFQTVDQEGNPKSLSDYAGKHLLLYFYPRDNTPGCTKEACGFRDIYGELKEHVEIVGVSGDSRNSHINFTEKYSLPFPLLADAEKKILDDYGANNLIFKKRVSFLIDPEGTIVKIYKSVKPLEHPAQVLRDIKEVKGA